MRTLIIVLGVVGITLVGAAGYFLFTPTTNFPSSATDATAPAATPAPMTDGVMPEALTGEATLLSLLARGEALECSITYLDATGNDIAGQYWFANGLLRGDFSYDVPDLGVTESSIILDETSFYAWSTIGGMQYGMRAARTDIETPAEAGELAVQQTVPLDARVTYECEPWGSVDASLFVPPSSVNFTDYSAVLERGLEYGTIYETP